MNRRHSLLIWREDGDRNGRAYTPVSRNVDTVSCVDRVFEDWLSKRPRGGMQLRKFRAENAAGPVSVLGSSDVVGACFHFVKRYVSLISQLMAAHRSHKGRSNRFSDRIAPCQSPFPSIGSMMKREKGVLYAWVSLTFQGSYITLPKFRLPCDRLVASDHVEIAFESRVHLCNSTELLTTLVRCEKKAREKGKINVRQTQRVFVRFADRGREREIVVRLWYDERDSYFVIWYFREIALPRENAKDIVHVKEIAETIL